MAGPDGGRRGPPPLLLELIRDEEIVVSLPVYRGAARLGRGSTNDLVLTDPDVSKHHAVVSMEADGPRIEDLRSTNGTFVNGERVQGSSDLTDRDLLRLGKTALIRVTVARRRPTLAPVVHDRTSGVRKAFMTDRFSVGTGLACDLRLPTGPEVAGTLLLHTSNEVWLGTEDDDLLLEIGVPFTLAGHELCLELPRGEDTPTFSGAMQTDYPYELTVSLNAPGGPVATLLDAGSGRVHAVTAGNRAILLYILARKLVEDREQGIAEAEAGWCNDDDVTTGVWGRNPPVGYNVLLHRLRKELKQAGFDPWFVEKRRGAVRARVERVEIRM